MLVSKSGDEEFLCGKNQRPSGSLQLFFFLIYLFFYWRIIALSIALVSTEHRHESAIGLPMSPPTWTSLPPPSLSCPSRLLPSPGLSSLSHTANSHCTPASLPRTTQLRLCTQASKTALKCTHAVPASSALTSALFLFLSGLHSPSLILGVDTYEFHPYHLATSFLHPGLGNHRLPSIGFRFDCAFTSSLRHIL